MAMRITLEVLLTLVITVLLAWLGLALLALVDASDPVAAFVDDAPRMLFGLMGPALAVWALLLVIGSIAHRRRRVGWRIATNLVSLAAVIVVTIVVLIVMAFATEGGWGLLLAGIALAAGVALMVAGVIAVLVVELAILRVRSREEPAGVDA